MWKFRQKKERLRNYEKEMLLKKNDGLTEVELCGEFHEFYK